MVKPTDRPLWQAARPRPSATWGLVGPAVPDGDGVLSSVDVLAPGQLDDQVLVHRRDGQEANRELVEGGQMVLLRQIS